MDEEGQAVEATDGVKTATHSDKLQKQNSYSDLAHVTRNYNFGELLPVEEDSEHEFKAIQQSGNPVPMIAQYCDRYINAFLNTEGGTIYFGVRDDGIVLGVPLNRKSRDTLRLSVDGIVSSFRPQVDPYLVRLDFVKVTVTAEMKVKLATKPRDKLPVNTHMRNSSKARSKNEEKWLHEDDPQEPLTLPASPENLYVVEITISKGRAPVYFCKGGGTVAYVRRAGSIHKMDFSMIEERKYMGRPTPLALISSEIGARLGKKPMPQSTPYDFIGREEELEMIRNFVGCCRSSVLTVILFGLPVVGKSALARRLAVEYSSTYPDRYQIIDVKGSVTKYESVVDLKKNVIRTEYPTMLQIPTDEKEIDSLYDSCFSQKRIILLIENAGYAKQIRDLTPTTARACLVLVTSRKDLALDSFDDITLDSTLSIRLSALGLNDAVKLLFALVQNNDTNRLTLEQAEEIVKLCGCLPLAIRMVGSTLRRKANIKPEEFIEKLRSDHERLKLVESSLLTSFETYGQKVRQNLMALSIFPGSFDGQAAAALFGCGYEEAQDNLGILLEFSLLDFDPVAGRYCMNDLFRLYCLKKAQELAGGEQVAIWHQRFLRYFKTLLESKTRELFGRDSSLYLPETRLEKNIRLAVSNFEEEEPGGLRGKCQQWYALEKHNYQHCLNFARQAKNYELVWQFAQAMTYFLEGENKHAIPEVHVEAAKWQELTSVLPPQDEIKAKAEEEKEKEKQKEQEKEKDPRQEIDEVEDEVIVWQGLKCNTK